MRPSTPTSGVGVRSNLMVGPRTPKRPIVPRHHTAPTSDVSTVVDIVPQDGERTSAPPTASTSPSASTQQSTLNILLVDDNKINIQVSMSGGTTTCRVRPGLILIVTRNIHREAKTSLCHSNGRPRSCRRLCRHYGKSSGPLRLYPHGYLHAKAGRNLRDSRNQEAGERARSGASIRHCNDWSRRRGSPEKCIWGRRRLVPLEAGAVEILKGIAG